ncbi:MAG: T9SS type A sorting domain-containing protein [Candidatus Kapaibacterium sp.]
MIRLIAILLLLGCQAGFALHPGNSCREGFHLDSAVYYVKFDYPQIGPWKSIRYFPDAKGRDTLIMTRIHSPNTIVKFFREMREYSPDGRLLSTLTQNTISLYPDEADWKNRKKIEYNYDGDWEYVKIYQWNDDECYLSSKSATRVNEDGLAISRKVEEFDPESGEWSNRECYTRTFDENGRIIEQENCMLDNIDEFVVYDYEFNDGELLSSTLYDKKNGVLTPYLKSTYKYSGKKKSYACYSFWKNDKWKKLFAQENEYDGMGNIIAINKYGFQNGEMSNDYLTKYEYDSNNLLIAEYEYKIVDAPEDLELIEMKFYHYSPQGKSETGAADGSLTDINIHPNPAGDVLNFEINQGGFDKFIIKDLSGRIALEGAIGQPRGEIDISPLGAGVYFIRFISPTDTIYLKFIKN